MDADADARSAAVWALGSVADRSSGPAVEPLLRDPAMAARLGAEGRVVARERYDIATQAGRLCDLYREVMRA